MKVISCLVLLIVVFPHCRNDIDISQPINKPEISTWNPFAGDWYYSFPFYSSELHINKDGTFRYHSRGCMGHGYSEGKWVQTDLNTIVLTSFEEYRHEKEDEVQIEVIDVPESKSKKTKNSKTKSGEIQFDLDAFTNRMITYHVKRSDTSNMMFVNQRIILQDGGLYWLDEKGIKNDSKYIRNGELALKPVNIDIGLKADSGR